MYSARERHVPIRKRYFAGKTRDGCEKAQPGSAAGLPVLSEVLRNPITLQFYSELYTKLYALSPFCFFFSAAFAFLAEGLKKDTILCMPPRYRYVQIKTTAKLKLPSVGLTVLARRGREDRQLLSVASDFLARKQ